MKRLMRDPLRSRLAPPLSGHKRSVPDESPLPDRSVSSRLRDAFHCVQARPRKSVHVAVGCRSSTFKVTCAVPNLARVCRTAAKLASALVQHGQHFVRMSHDHQPRSRARYMRRRRPVAPPGRHLSIEIGRRLGRPTSFAGGPTSEASGLCSSPQIRVRGLRPMTDAVLAAIRLSTQAGRGAGR